MNSNTKIVLAALKFGFSLTLAQFQSAILMTLVAYWLFSRWEAISERFSPERLGPLMLTVIIGFALFVATMFAMDWGSEYWLLAAMLGFSLALAMCDTSISICVFVCLLFLRPWEIIQENDYFLILPKLTMSLCIVNVLIDLARQKKLTLKWNKTATALIAFAIWLLVTTLKSGSEAQSVFFDTFFKNTFLFVIVLNLVKDREELDLIVWTIVITMFGVGAASIVQTLDYRTQALITGADLNSDDLRLVGFGAFGNSNDIAALMVMVMPFCFVPVLRKGSRWLARIVGVAVVGMVIACLAMAKSRGAQLGVVAMIGIYGFLKMKNRKHATILACVCALGMLVATQLTNRNADDLDESKRFRMIYLETALVMGVKNPVLGVGFNGYADNFTRYQTGEVDGTLNRTAHNSWALAFAETGVLGIILFISIFVSALRSAWAIRAERPEFLLAIIGYGIAMTFLSHTYFIYPYLLYALIGIAEQQFGDGQKPVADVLAATGQTPEPLPS